MSTTQTSSTEFDREKVMGRIAKMLALANDAAASEGERDNAMRMAHATLAKYNLKLSEVEQGGGKKGEKRIDSGIEGRDFPWALRTAQALAGLFFCEYFYVRLKAGKVKHYFVGRESNVETAKEMAKYVVASIMKEGTRRSRDVIDQPGQWQRNFCKGASHQVYVRCLSLRKDAEDESSGAKPASKVPGTALVLASVYEQEEKANSAYLSDVLKITLKSSSSGERRAGEGYRAGQEFGKNVSLSKQVGSNGNSGKLLK